MGGSNAKLRIFHEAVTENKAEMVRELLSDDDVDPNTPGLEKLTALHLAITHGSLKSLKLLLSSIRVDLSPLTPNKETLLILAISKGHEDIGLYLLENLPGYHLHMESVDRHGYQVLHHASCKGHERMMTKLLACALPVDTVGGKLNQTPLMLAAQNNQDSMVQVLLDAGASRAAVDLAKMTPLHHACLANAESCVSRLIQGNEVCIDAKDISGCTPLIYCLNNKNSGLEKLLVSHGACLTDALDAGFSTFCYHTLQKT